MTDKIKRFFRKAKADMKFANAGKGHKLTESTTSIRTNIVEPIERVEPTEEAKIAGQAALARLEGKQSNVKRLNTSYASIKAQVRRELEEEENRKAQKNTVRPKAKEENIKNPSLLAAVSNIFYRCPYLSDEVLPKDEWKARIREFLYGELSGQEPGLIACLIIQNCNFNKDKINTCVDTLGKYLENIINNPDEEKFKKIRMQNKIFQDKVLPIEGSLEFLTAAGFKQEKLLNNEKEEDFLVWTADKCEIKDLIMLVEAVKSAERIPLELDRNLQVLLPAQASKKANIPSDFFNLTPEELRREQQRSTTDVEMNQVFKTKAMREKEQEQELRKYKFSWIRIKFPDNLFLQGTFSVHENFQNVVTFVRENLVNHEKPFNLLKLPNTIMNENCYNKTLLELGLFPYVLLMFSWEKHIEETTSNETIGYLKEELLSIIQPI